MSNKYLYIGNKTFKGPLDSFLAYESVTALSKAWQKYIDSLPSIPYIGKEDDFKPDQICEEGKEIRVGYQMKLNTDWIDATMWIYGHTSDTSKRTVVLPNTPVVPEGKEKDNVPSSDSGWIRVEDKPESVPPECTVVLGQSPEWIDEDYEPEGIRECFYNDGVWTSAVWDNEQDTWTSDEKTSPKFWMRRPLAPNSQKEK